MASQSYPTHSLTSWLSNMKTDDIDDCLAADFDGSLSGLGVELGSSTYNMSEALLALPVFKQESVEQGFQYILSCATSPATKLYEETLTYLNQGQSYEIKVKNLGPAESLKGKKLRSVLRVIFHDRRLQYNEKEQLEFWMQNRPGERIVDVDVPLSYGVLEVKVTKNKLNSIELIWDPEIDTGVYIKIHAISTEFTPRKHGGEKGVPFRIQVETYLHDVSDSRLLHGASCQVRVFKPKGADRKHKTDREKIEKRSEAEKEKYQPSYECTVLTEIPVDQIKAYLNSLQEQETQSKKNVASPKSSPAVAIDTPPEGSTVKPDTPVVVPLPGPPTPPNVFCIKDLATFLDQTSSENTSRLSQDDPGGTSAEESSTNPLHMEPLSPKATAQQVTQWLHKYRFSNFVKVFQNFAGADLLRLSREDLIQICGLADGIRLDNALQSRTVRPKLTIYVSQSRGYGVSGFISSGGGGVGGSHNVTPVSSSASSPQDASPQMSACSPIIGPSSGPSQGTACSLQPTSEETDSEKLKENATHKAVCSARSEKVTDKRTSQSGMPGVADVMPPPVVIPLKVATLPAEKQSEHISPTRTVSKINGPSKARSSSPAEQTMLVALPGDKKVTGTSQGWKRQYKEEVDAEEVYTTKKLRTRTLELSTKGVYHAVYLEFLTLKHLRDKLASLFSISPPQILEIHVQGPSGIHVLVTDNVVQNFPDQTRYSIEAYEDDATLGHYKILLQSIQYS